MYVFMCICVPFCDVLLHVHGLGEAENKRMGMCPKDTAISQLTCEMQLTSWSASWSVSCSKSRHLSACPRILQYNIVL